MRGAAGGRFAARPPGGHRHEEGSAAQPSLSPPLLTAAALLGLTTGLAQDARGPPCGSREPVHATDRRVRDAPALLLSTATGSEAGSGRECCFPCEGAVSARVLLRPRSGRDRLNLIGERTSRISARRR